MEWALVRWVIELTDINAIRTGLMLSDMQLRVVRRHEQKVVRLRDVRQSFFKLVVLQGVAGIPDLIEVAIVRDLDDIGILL
jgi:hypothetical protein